jgi:hypothetical protein
VGQWVSRRLKPQANMKLAEPITLELQKGSWQRSSEQSLGSRRYCTWILRPPLGCDHNGPANYIQFDPTKQRSPLSANPWHVCLCAEASGTAYHEPLPRIDIIQYRL